MTITLPDDRAKRVLDEAQRLGVEPEKLLLAWVDEHVGEGDPSVDVQTHASVPPFDEKAKKELLARIDKALGPLAKLPRKRDSLSRVLGLGRTNKPPPDDAEVKRILLDRRMEKYGQGLTSTERNGSADI